MTETPIRKLAAVLAADVVGYSRLMGADEAATLARLKALHRELMQPQIAGHSGRIVKLMGDGLLAEFPSAVEAVRCAVDIQKAMAAREAALPDDRRLRLRIGINLGDLMVEGRDIYGDGVNVAARLEALAAPGGICLSGTAFDTVDGKLDVSFRYDGEHRVKNIVKALRVYRWSLEASPAPAAMPSDGPLPLPDKPSVAVLPFTNMSGDPDQIYFSDGITEDIITELSRFSLLFVIARNSSFAFRKRDRALSEVGRELGVRYLVEGSVRRAGNRVRVTAQLVDAVGGNHIWADRYDRELADIFAVQDEVVQAIVATLAQRVSAAEVARSARYAGPETAAPSLAVYDLILRAHHHIGVWARADYLKARDLLKEALAIDPDCAQAHGSLAWCSAFLTWWEGEDAVPVADAMAAGKRALALDPKIVEAHTGLAHAYLMSGAHKQALHHIETAVSLNPNNANALCHLGYHRSVMGDSPAGLRLIGEAIRLNPYHPDWYLESYGEILYMARDFEAAVEAFNRMTHMAPWSYGYLAAAYAQLGAIADAREAVAACRGLAKEGLSAEDYVRMDLPIYGSEDVKALWLEGYRKAGLDL